MQRAGDVTRVPLAAGAHVQDVWRLAISFKRLVEFVHIPAGAPAKKAHLASTFDLFPILADRQRQRAGTLSGGQQRMLSIGMTLMRGPEVLLLDEPSLGLSPLLVESLYNVIARVRQELGITVVVVEQSLDPGLLKADKLHILRMGKVVFSGNSDVLFDKQKLWNLL